ncbi:MAG: TIR domain-containing protein [bacterium]|nr:TIR domain-containing protein [bacterium]
MSKFFISYRRSDTEQIAGRIVERLSKRFGVGSIFFDMDSIPVGDDYRKHLNRSMRQCQVLLALIGEKWLEKGTLGEPRILNARDPVRIEIESAFNFHGFRKP